MLDFLILPPFRKMSNRLSTTTLPANARVARRVDMAHRHVLASRRAGVRGPQCAMSERVVKLERLPWKTRNRFSKSYVCGKLIKAPSIRFETLTSFRSSHPFDHYIASPFSVHCKTGISCPGST